MSARAERDEVHACHVCGSFKIEASFWVHLNSNQPRDQCDEDYWCPACQEHCNGCIVLYRMDDGEWSERFRPMSEDEQTWTSLRDAVRELRNVRNPRATARALAADIAGPTPPAGDA